jgi:hypothetical protein
MPKIKAIKPFIGHDGKLVTVGATVELDNALAQNLIHRGRAKAVEAKTVEAGDKKPADKK